MNFVAFTSFLVSLVTISMTQSCRCRHGQTYDYVIVGGGTTGSVVASRLSEMAKVSVLVLEAGSDPSPVSEIPFLTQQVLSSSAVNWNYMTQPQKYCCRLLDQRSMPMVTGRGLGGTSSLDYMLYTRGNRKDFDQWHASGNDGWSFRQLEPYFRKLEDYRIPQRAYQTDDHSRTGKVAIESPRFRSAMSDAFLLAGHQLGGHLTDVNGENQTGFSSPPFFIQDGGRCSSYGAYLRPAMSNRKNLVVARNVRVTKILLDNRKRAFAVRFKTGNDLCQVKAKKEIILSAGVFNTPQLLMLSGIGPAKILRKCGIPVKQNLPGVGQNLQDHVTVHGLSFQLNRTIGFDYDRHWNSETMDLWIRRRTGPLTSSSSFEGIAFYKTKYADRYDDRPDLEILFKSDNPFEHEALRLPPYISGYLLRDTSDVVTFYPVLLHPRSRGYVTINSSNPFRNPVIDPNYLAHSSDVKVLSEGWKLAIKLAKSESFARFGARLANDGVFPDCLTHVLSKFDYIKCIVRNLAYTMHDPVGTCKMGPKSDPMAVVDNQLRVRGVGRLRIADASIMPEIVTGHARTACIVIGEKVADLIKKNN